MIWYSSHNPWWKDLDRRGDDRRMAVALQMVNGVCGAAKDRDEGVSLPFVVNVGEAGIDPSSVIAAAD